MLRDSERIYDQPLDINISTLDPVIQEYIKLSKFSDTIKGNRDKSHKIKILNQLRPAIAALPLDQAREVTSRMDGLIAMLIIIAIVDEMKMMCEQELREKYNLDTTGICVKFEKVFESRLDQMIATRKPAVITEDDLNGIVELAVTECWQGCAIHSKPAHPTPQFIALMNNFVFMILAGQVYGQTDELQVASTFTLTMGSLAAKVRALSRDKIVQPYRGLIMSSKILTFTESTAPKWLELSIWLMALHNRLHRAYPANIKDANGHVKPGQDGHFPTLDTTDTMFKAMKEVTKYEMSLNNFALSRILETMFSQFHAKKQASAGAIIPPAASPSAAAAGSVGTSAPVAVRGSNRSLLRRSGDGSPEGPAPVEEIRFAYKPDETTYTLFPSILAPNGLHAVVVPDDKTKLAELELTNKAILRPESLTEEEIRQFGAIYNRLRPINNFSMELHKYISAPDNDKLIRLKYCLNKYVLSGDQIQQLSVVAEQIRPILESYINTGGYVFKAYHNARARETIERLASCDVKHQILELFALRDYLTSENSDSLIKKVDGLLISVFNTLLDEAPTLAVQSSPSIRAV